VLCWYLEDSARVELDLRAIVSSGASPTELSASEAKCRATWDGAILERMWAYLTHGDPEVQTPT
jgi:HCOMODA/2-hydroxy-3-carboxy-muconic semialdehyde decarboxylase